MIFTTYDIGRMTGTDPTTVHKWIDRGLLKGYRTPGGHRRVRGEDLRAFLLSHRMPVPKELGGTDALRVLVADGDAGAARSILRSLKRLKPTWEVATATGGVEALLTASRDLPDVLAFDLHLPEVDGLAVCKHLQNRPETAAVKLLALATRVSAELERKAKSAGACAVLEKPVSGAELAEAIELALGLQPAAELA
jgi:excisionase family DNA binding protein